MSKKILTIFCLGLLISINYTAISNSQGIQFQTNKLSPLDVDIIEMIQQVNENLVFYYHSNLGSKK